MKKISFLSFIFLLFISCASTKIDNNNESQFSMNCIDNGIEILIPQNINFFYLYRDVDADIYDWQGKYKYEDETIDNNMVFVDEEECSLKMYDFRDHLMAFILVNQNGRKIDIKGKKIVLQSKRLLSYSDAIVDTQVKINGERYGSRKEPLNCYLYLRDCKLGEITEVEQKKIDLAKSIIVKKYGFKDTKDFNNWKKRATFSNLYESLSEFYENYSYPFVENDIIPVKEQNLVIMDMVSYGNGYLYLMTRQHEQYPYYRCCKVYSDHVLKYYSGFGNYYLGEELLLQYIGSDKYQKEYKIQECDVFKVIEKNSKTFNEYYEMIQTIENIEKNPYKFVD